MFTIEPLILTMSAANAVVKLATPKLVITKNWRTVTAPNMRQSSFSENNQQTNSAANRVRPTASQRDSLLHSFK